jgi:hypothetical protein
VTEILQELINKMISKIEDDENMLELKKPYKFITKMIASSFPIIEYN